MAKQTFTTGQVLTAAQMTSLQDTAMGGGAATAKTASYVLVAADAGTTVAMNAAGATTITVNTGLFAAGDTVFIQNIGAGVCTITAGTATVNTAGALALPQYDAGILYFTSASAAIFYDYIQVGAVSPLTTKGDLYTFSTSDTRLGVGANDTVLTADSGEATGLKWAAPAAAAFVGVSASGSGKTNSNATFVSVDFDTEAFDTDAIHSTTSNTSRFTVPSGKGGKWMFLFFIAWQAGTYTEIVSRWYKNGVQQGDRTVGRQGGAAGNISPVIFNLSAADYIEVFTYQDSGGNKNTESPFMYVAYLGA